MTSPGQNPADSLRGSPDEERIGELINEFFDRREGGEDLTADGFLAEHPEHASELRGHLGGLDLIAAMDPSSGQQTTLPGGRPPPPKGSSAEDQLGSQTRPLPEVAGYDIVKQIGRGGMGVVFKAIQLSTKRAVALKLLLEGPLASESSRRRFEREIALAAQLRHSNIIPIYDSGAAEGRMYYAMEYVHGLALSNFLRVHKIDIRAKLRLFAKIAHAVSHAHQRGVVHRDLKPSNILIDGASEPHILDFGLAKASALGDLTTSITAQVIGTPAYMSPEQAAGDPDAIDTRTDVYSLGVVLYEMLTGRMPYDTSGAVGKVLQNVADADPTPPSKHDSRIGGELSAILLKALEKNKEDRYQSVDAFCGDVQRYLAGEPISAKPASSIYLLRKAIRNNRLAVAFCALVVVFAAIVWGVAHYHSTKFEYAQQRLRQLEDTVSQQQTEVEKHRQDAAAELALDREQAQVARREIEWLLENADEDAAKILAPLAEGLGNSANRGDSASTALLSSFVAVVREQLRPEPEEPVSKDLDYDPTRPLMSPRPEGLREGPPDSVSREELAEALAKWLLSLPATSQPATTQPATTAPAPPDPDRRDS
ncbi:MAG: protein kinase [Phycisphaerae bacterium]|nr:protein kinase [Phycisphaerae bacterium]